MFCHALATRLFPICRSITGNGVRQTLSILEEHLPRLQVHEVASGSAAFDWTVPAEWNIDEAYIEDEQGRRIVEFATSNLHVVGYSVPVDEWIELEDLQLRLHSLPEQPEAIPYVTSYYSPYWGFCLSQEARGSLAPGRYHAVIRSALAPGSLTYGELFLPGREDEEVLISTYVCHPSLANNELSGPAVVTALAQWLMEKYRRYSYRSSSCPRRSAPSSTLAETLSTSNRRSLPGST